MIKKVTNPNWTVKEELKSEKLASPGGQHDDYARSADRTKLPPPGPSNIIVRTPSPLPAPKDVRSQ